MIAKPVSRLVWWPLVAAVLALSLPAAPPAAAQETGLTPDWGGGALTVRGGGFQAREQVTLIATVGQGQAPQTFSATADGAGRFTVQTGMRVPPGGRVSLEARGNRGTALAAITSAPVAPVGPEAGDATVGPARLPRGPGPYLALLAAAGGLAALAIVSWRTRARRPA